MGRHGRRVGSPGRGLVDDQVGECVSCVAEAFDRQYSRTPVCLCPARIRLAGGQHHDERHSWRQEDEPHHRDLQMRALQSGEEEIWQVVAAEVSEVGGLGLESWPLTLLFT